MQVNPNLENSNRCDNFVITLKEKNYGSFCSKNRKFKRD